MATVDLRGVEKTFGSVIALSNMTLRIEQGEFVALLGPSGCGKTTTLNLIAGFITPSAGEILFNDEPITAIPPNKRNIGVVFQSYALFPHLNVFENVAFGLRMRKVPQAEIGSRVRRALDIVHLAQMEERLPRQLSGGQQQRVALARALVIEPAVLLLDEPLSNLDASLREQMRFEIREIQKRVGITTVFVTHDQGEAMAAADRLVVMDKGHIRQVGSAREIYETPADTFVAGFIGQANLLRGTITAVNGPETLVRLEGGETIIAPSRAGCTAGDRAIVVLRPEDAAVLTSPPPEHNHLSGQLARASLLGPIISVGVRGPAGGSSGEITVTVPRGTQLPPEGGPVSVTWPRTACLLFAEPE